VTTTLDAPTVITEPGVYTMPAEAYHRDPVPGGSLSRSGAKLLLPPSCPALFRWEQDNPPAPKAAYDFGNAAHRLVLGVGPDIEVIDAENWRTKAAQEAKAEAHAEGLVPLLRDDYAEVKAMADALAAHPVARALFNGDTGKAEQSLFWQDERTGIWLRCRLDWLPDASSGRTVIPDYKTTKAADLESISKALLNYGYCQQAPWYVDGVRAVGHADDVAFVFVFQEKTPPYLVTVVQPDWPAMRIGQALNRKAVDIYVECVASGRWPGYAEDVEIVSLPAWAEHRLTEEYL